jgi:tetratricopeptide (TPR) repeat protein
LGLSLMNQGKKADALNSFKKAVAINPNYIRAQLQMGITQTSMGLHEDALTSLGAIIEKHPTYADVYYLMGIVKEECHETDEAIKFLKKAIQISPKFKNALIKLTMYYYQTGKIDEAQKQIKQAIQLYPKDKRLIAVKKFFKQSNPYLKSQDDISKEVKLLFKKDLSFSDLRNEFHKGLDIMPNFSEIIAMFNSSKYAQEDASISDFLIPFISDQIEQNPTYPDLYNSLGTQLSFSNSSL